MPLFKRQSQCGKVIVTLVLLIVGLQVFHMGLLMKLEQKKDNLPNERLGVNQENAIKIDTVGFVHSVMETLADVHITDSSGTYHIIPNMVSPDAKMRLKRRKHFRTITLVTQSSANHLDNLILLSKIWDGPISVSVFTYKNDAFFALTSIFYLRICYPGIAEKVTFHLVYPMNSSPPKMLYDKFSDFKIVCNKPFNNAQIHQSVDNYAISGIEYPHNLLRNIALKSSKTPYIFMIDIDMVPSLNLTIDFTNFIEKERNSNFEYDRTIFVVPSFESKDSLIPSNKFQLLKAWDSETIRPFYYEVCWKCQKHTEYERWKTLFSSNSLDIGYSVEWKDPWEPFFIVSRKAPIYDERFKQYGFNRISQVCELQFAGYNFVVLNNAFLVHKGFKVPGKFHKSKDIEQDRNRILFRKFKEELKTKYPKSFRRC